MKPQNYETIVIKANFYKKNDAAIQIFTYAKQETSSSFVMFTK